MQRFSRYRAHCGRDARGPSKSLDRSWQVPWAVALQLDEWFVMIGLELHPMSDTAKSLSLERKIKMQEARDGIINRDQSGSLP